MSHLECSHVYEIVEGKEYEYCENQPVFKDGTVHSCAEHRGE